MKKVSIFCTLFTVVFLIFNNLQAKAPRQLDRRLIVLRAMAEEMKRSMSQLQMPQFEKPYYMVYEMKHAHTKHLQSRYGAIFKSSENENRRLRVEIRVGSYKFDNIGSKSNAFGFSFSSNYRAPVSAPLDDDPLALKNALWLMTDQTYKKALKAFLKRKSFVVTEVDDGKDIDSFSKEPPSKHIDKPKAFSFDKERWKKVARSASALFENHPHIFDSNITIDASKEVRYLVSSEGTRVITERTLYNISVYAVCRAEDGMLLTTRKTMYVPEESKIYADQQIFKTVKDMIANLEALRDAPILEPYTGPAILDGEATGVLFHEVGGHRREGERQLDEEEGKTFKGQVGKKIIPEFLSIIDDPTRRKVSGIDLNGFYRFDDEGVKAQKVTLVDKGYLKGFLTSRTPIEGFSRSNGHGRASAGEKPRARMANTIVVSHKKVSFEKLKKALIAEVKKQKKPYGLIIKNIVGGSTHTSTWGYQAYKGTPEMVYRVLPDGKEELVRGVEIVGTPIASINKIIATSDKTGIFNGFCGAESGYIPVSAAAPDVLMIEIELQRTRKKSAKGQIMPSPWTIPAETTKTTKKSD